MTPQEAIEAIKLKNIHIESDAIRITAFFQGLSVAKEALEKQIPKKPLAHGKYNFICPLCKQDLGIEREDISVYEMTPPKHCDKCGQALDWSDTE